MRSFIILFFVLYGFLLAQAKKETGDTIPVKKESTPVAEKIPAKKTETAEKEEDPEELLKKYAGESSGTGSSLNPFAGEEFKPKFQLGGFMDIQAVKAIPVKGSDNILYKQLVDSSLINEGLFYPMFPANTSFRLANINLYNTFQVTDNWKAFAEIRFMTNTGVRDQALHSTTTPQGYNLTNGAPISGSGGYDGNGVKVEGQGGIFIERAYIEWDKYEKLSFRAGKFFTPLGLWNQDHGAPILTSIRLPLTVTNPLSYAASPPLWNTGGQVFGKFFLGDDVIFDYIAFVGNGQCNDCDRVDDDRNKSFGGFGNFKITNVFKNADLDIGASGYNGDRTIVDYYAYRNSRAPLDLNAVATSLGQQIAAAQQNNVLQTAPDANAYSYDRMRTSYFRKQNDVYGAGHIKLAVRDLPLKGTFVLQMEGWRQFTVNYPRMWDAGRTFANPNPNVNNQRLVKPENYTVNTYYIQMEYRFFGKYTPYLRYDDLSNNMVTINSGKYFIGETFGFNWKIDPKVVFKAETTLIRGQTPAGIGGASRIYAVSLSVAF